MPRMDGTGPAGTGPNGRGLGPCGQGGEPIGRGRGGFGGMFRRGWGGRRGMRGGFGGFATAPVEDKQSLEQHESWLKQQLEAVQARIQSFNKD